MKKPPLIGHIVAVFHLTHKVDLHMLLLRKKEFLIIGITEDLKYEINKIKNIL